MTNHHKTFDESEECLPLLPLIPLYTLRSVSTNSYPRPFTRTDWKVGVRWWRVETRVPVQRFRDIRSQRSVPSKPISGWYVPTTLQVIVSIVFDCKLLVNDIGVQTTLKIHISSKLGVLLELPPIIIIRVKYPLYGLRCNLLDRFQCLVRVEPGCVLDP